MKHFVLDTNVLLYDPHAVFKFEENEIIIPITVIEEIDRFKKDMNETGRNARQVSRFLDELRKKGSLSAGIGLETGGTLRVEIYEEKVMKQLPPELRAERGDNRILAVAFDVKAKSGDAPVIFVTKDTNLRIKADALGLRAEDYETDRVNPGDLYHGAAEFFLDPKDVRRLREGEPIPLPAGSYYPNQYAWVRSDQESSLSALARVSPDQTELRPLRVPSRTIHGLTPRNKEQQFALDALLDPERDFVIRRRVPRLLARLANTRSVEGLFTALEDARFEVRFHAAACGSRRENGQAQRRSTRDLRR